MPIRDYRKKQINKWKAKYLGYGEYFELFEQEILFNSDYSNRRLSNLHIDNSLGQFSGKYKTYHSNNSISVATLGINEVASDITISKLAVMDYPVNMVVPVSGKHIIKHRVQEVKVNILDNSFVEPNNYALANNTWLEIIDESNNSREFIEILQKEGTAYMSNKAIVSMAGTYKAYILDFYEPVTEVGTCRQDNNFVLKVKSAININN